MATTTAGTHVPVLIVGGGPIGLALAADLGRRGVRVRMVERSQDRLGSAKMIVVSVRTMEIVRQLGIAEPVRHWGFPEDQSLDSIFVTTLPGYELGRVPSPPLNVQFTTSLSPERERPCPQTWFDPIVQRKARSEPSVTLSYETELVSFEQDEQKVTATLRHAKGDTEVVTCDYLVGADGFGSTVRELLGIEIRGNKHLDRTVSLYVRSSDLWEGHDKGKAYRYVMVDEHGTWSVLTTIDGHDLWRIQLIGVHVEKPEDLNVPEILERMAGRPIKHEVVDVSFWIRKMTVADRFIDGRVMIAGDSAHAHPPNGGLGMNTGLQDSFDLAWKLDAVLKGWGGASLLDSYDYERRPASSRAANESLRNYYRLTGHTAEPKLNENSAEGAAARARLGATLVSENEKAWLPIGIHLGYIYHSSPIVVPDGSPKPKDDADQYVPTTFPGARAPHAWLSEGKSTLDLFGDGFVLLDFSGAKVDALLKAAAARGVPMKHHRIHDAKIAELYERPLVLVRPDGHVAWRGTEVPADAYRIIDTIRGAGPLVGGCRAGDPAPVRETRARR